MLFDASGSLWLFSPRLRTRRRLCRRLHDVRRPGRTVREADDRRAVAQHRQHRNRRSGRSELRHDSERTRRHGLSRVATRSGTRTTATGRCTSSRSTSIPGLRHFVLIGDGSLDSPHRWPSGISTTGSDRAGPDTFAFGLPTYIPVVGDWDGNGTRHLGVFDSTAPGICGTATRRAHPTSPSPTALPADTPVVGDWDGNGTDTIGVYVGNGCVVPPQQQHAGAAGHRRPLRRCRLTRRSSATGTATAPTPSASTSTAAGTSATATRPGAADAPSLRRRRRHTGRRRLGRQRHRHHRRLRRRLVVPPQQQHGGPPVHRRSTTATPVTRRSSVAGRARPMASAS